MKYTRKILIILIVLVGVFYLKTKLATSQQQPNVEIEASPILYDRANYLNYSEQNLIKARGHGNTLLFFAATTWCSNCRAIEEEIIKRNSELPQNLTILKVDYDGDAEMKKKHGVTMQTTLILLDKDGKEIKRWIGTDFDNLQTNIN